MKQFVVVEFLEEQKDGSCAMDIFSSAWLINSSLAYWPTYMKNSIKIEKAVRDGKLPNSSWTQVKIRMLHDTGLLLLKCS